MNTEWLHWIRFYKLNIFKWKIDRKGDQALPWFSYSLNVMDCVCTCRPIQCNSMCYATHACVWRMQLDLLNRVCTFGFSLGILMWGESSLGLVVWSLKNHFGSSYLHWMPLKPWHVYIAWLTDLAFFQSLLHGSKMTLSLSFARCDVGQNLPLPPLLYSSFLSSFNTFCFAHIYSRFLPFFWLMVFMKRSHSQLYQQTSSHLSKL